MARRAFFAVSFALALVACGGPPPDRKPVAQESIGTNTGVPPSAAALEAADASSSSSSNSSTPTPATTSETANPTVDSSDPSSPPPSGSGKIADLCPPKGKKPDLSKLATKTGCKGKTPPRTALLAELRGMEQLLAATTPSSSDREALLLRLAQGYAQLECGVAAACANATTRETAALPDDIALAEITTKTQQHCGTLKSEFPKSKRQCP